MKKILALLLLLPATLTLAEEGWPTWGGPPGASKYSSLDQINRDNVKDLEVAWTYRSGDFTGAMAQISELESAIG